MRAARAAKLNFCPATRCHSFFTRNPHLFFGECVCADPCVPLQNSVQKLDNGWDDEDDEDAFWKPDDTGDADENANSPKKGTRRFGRRENDNDEQ